ncbi:hypothetical protein MA16_Dca000816 [Dendrobium catenatum]|uniref:Retrotransposon gag domain-containing protein n=1 Tax=Dendrobium catenatum TaxID=906689 RepID=A0A2I0WUY3_9ASPA|nr:hypothetical protein MA16_Dca000816 [Dendrobium catenatum]
MVPTEILNWIQMIERILDFKDILPDRIVKLVAIKLKKSASLWWENFKRNRNREGRGKITMWAKMKKELQRKYFPKQYRQELFLKFHRLQQNQLTVEQYIAVEQYIPSIMCLYSRRGSTSTLLNLARCNQLSFESGRTANPRKYILEQETHL